MKPVQLKKRPSSKTARLVAALAMSSLGLITTAHAQSAAFTLSSPDLASGSFDNKFILNGFGCTGGNVSPSTGVAQRSGWNQVSVSADP